MAFLSNGQSKASRLTHSNSYSESGKASHSGQSRSDSDSEEQRLHAKVSRSDSEHEEMSTRPAPERQPAAPPSVKNNSKSSDSSRVRNQRNLSEPNTNTPTASKSKKGVAAKRAQNDNFAEEQPESKKKKSVSEAKKDAAEDDDVDGEQAEPKKKSRSKGKNAAVVKDDEVAEEKKSFHKGKKSVSAEKEAPASNPHQKKPRKEQESVSAEKEAPASNPHQKKPRKEQESAEATAAKNPEKKARVWTEKDENVIMHCYLVCSGEGLQYSKNHAQFFKKMNDSLAHKASETQLYEKVRSMKKRYTNIQNKMAKGGIKEDAFVYKSPHEKEVYKLWKQAWGEQHEEDEMELGHNEAIGDDMHQPGEDQTSARNQIAAGEDQTSAGNNMQDQIITGKDSPDPITAGKDHTPAGDRGARAQMLEEKWRELEILETQATMMRYSLLHEKCALHLESLKAPRSNSRSS